MSSRLGPIERNMEQITVMITAENADTIRKFVMVGIWTAFVAVGMVAAIMFRLDAIWRELDRANRDKKKVRRARMR